MILALLLASQGDLPSLEARATRSPNAYNFRILADAYLAAERFQDASGAFAKASKLYGQMGDPNAAIVLEQMAKRYRTTITLYVEQPLNQSYARKFYTGAKFEPLHGCLVGANVEREDYAGDPADFVRKVGKDHAIFFMYRSWGTPFPTQLARELKSMGAGLQIAWEPRSVAQVRNDTYLDTFIRDISRCGIPVFLRFASEMNGTWTGYHGDPAAYKSMFRMVADEVHRGAANAAIVWCPNESPQAEIDAYYPGPQAVDWVGVNFYSVLYFDGIRSRPAWWRNPTDAIDYVYSRYSKTHPIMIGEWAATHRSVIDPAPNPQFAADKIGQFYAALPRKYPRVKAVNWLSMNTIEHASGPRKLNDFSLLENRSVAMNYRYMLLSPYYLETIRVDRVPSSPVQYVPLTPGMKVPYGSKLSILARSYEQRPRVTVNVGTRQVLSRQEVDDYGFVLQGKGQTAVTVTLTDSKGRAAGKLSVPVVVE